MFEIFRIIILLFGTTFAGLWDLKTTDVPDSVIITMIAVGFSLHIAEGFITGSFSMLMNSLFYGGLFLLFALFMYFTGQWGGGDGEILVSVAILLPSLSFLNTSLPFPVIFFLNMIIIGAVYSVIYSFILSFRNKKILRQFKKDFKKDRITQATMAMLVILILLSFYLGSPNVFPLMLFLLFVLVFFYKFAKIVEKGFYVKIKITKLRPGDMIGEDIPKLKIFKRYIKGLTKEEVKRIKRLKRYVLIRSGVRFGPVFFITLILTLLLGNLFFVLF